MPFKTNSFNRTHSISSVIPGRIEWFPFLDLFTIRLLFIFLFVISIYSIQTMNEAYVCFSLLLIIRNVDSRLQDSSNSDVWGSVTIFYSKQLKCRTLKSVWPRRQELT